MNPYYTNVSSNTRITGTFYHGGLQRTKEEKLFIEKFNALVVPHMIRSTDQKQPIDILHVNENQGVQITMSKEHYMHLVEIVNDFYNDKFVRDGNTEAYNLYMRYKTYIELLK